MPAASCFPKGKEIPSTAASSPLIRCKCIYNF
jgi:hypothetical protein